MKNHGLGIFSIDQSLKILIKISDI
jgi:hypothetical protein